MIRTPPPFRMVPLRHSLGAEELLELGRGGRPALRLLSQAAQPSVAPSIAAPPPQRVVAVTREEGMLLVHVVEKIVAFAKGYPLEFTSYCPTDRWQQTLIQVGSWTAEIEKQVKAGQQMVNVPAEMVFRLVDLEKCISAARDARLHSAKLAFTFSAVGAIADMVFGLTWLGLPAYIAGLAVLFGQPLVAKFSAEPEEPYKPAISGCGSKFALGGCPAPHETDEQKKMPKLIERIILPPEKGIQRYYWGAVHCVGSGREGAICLKKGRFRVRVEGWEGDIVVPVDDWEFAQDCVQAVNEIGVWEAPGMPRTTAFGPIPKKSHHPLTYWVEYTGPNTDGRIRRAGPFGCPFDTRDHALEDGAIKKPGVDGDFALFDGDGDVVEIPAEEPQEAVR